LFRYPSAISFRISLSRWVRVSQVVRFLTPFSRPDILLSKVPFARGIFSCLASWLPRSLS
jgi:hypothetical protein